MLLCLAFMVYYEFYFYEYQCHINMNKIKNKNLSAILNSFIAVLINFNAILVPF